MTQPDRPDRAAAEQLGTERVTAQLRQAARTYEPDAERIRRLMESKAQAGGGVLVRVDPPRGLGGRPVLWPAVGAAAAAVIVAVVAVSGQPRTDRPGPAAGTVTVASSPAAPSPTSSPASGTASPTGTATPSTTASARTPAGTATVTGPGQGTTGGTLDGATTGGAPEGTAGSTGPAPSHPSSGGKGGTTSGSVGGRRVTATVTAVPAGSQVDLGLDGERWIVASAITGSAQPHSVGNGNAIGAVQPLATGAAVAPGPFRVGWSNGEPTATGTSTSWLEVPVPGTNSSPLIRVPVRFRTDTPRVALYVGTIGGGGRLEIGVTNSSPLRVSLPSCSGTCAFVVTITSEGGPGVPTTGDLPVDVFATDADRVAVAAASLS